MEKRKIHTIIKKYNQFNERFGDDQYNIEIFVPYHKNNYNRDVELYVVETEDELYTTRIPNLFRYILGEVDYYENNLSQSEGGLQEQLEDAEERKAFRQYIKYLKNNCKGE